VGSAARKRDKHGRFAKGKSGNPRGRPPAEICLTALLRAALAERDRDGKRTKARAVIDALISVACEGKTAAIQQVFDRIDGLLLPILQGSAVDLETIAREMAAKRGNRSGSTGGSPG